MTYGDFEDLKKNILYKKIVHWTNERLILEDGTIVTIEESEQDCCASAGGDFFYVNLEAVITDIKIGDIVSNETGDETRNEVIVTIFHNQNPIAIAQMYADDGNGGYYYSIASLVVNGIHYKIVEA